MCCLMPDLTSNKGTIIQGLQRMTVRHVRLEKVFFCIVKSIKERSFTPNLDNATKCHLLVTEILLFYISLVPWTLEMLN